MPMTSTEFTVARRLVGLTAQQVAERLGVQLRSVQRFESGERAVSAGIAAEMRAMVAEHDSDTENMLRHDPSEPVTMPAPTSDKPASWWLAVAARVMALNSETRFV